MNATPTDPLLPDLTEERVDAIEAAVFARIAGERQKSRVRRSRWWITGAAAAAVVVVAVVISPYVTSRVSLGASNESAVAPAGDGDRAVPLSGSVTQEEIMPESAAGSAADVPSSSAADGGREIATTASATLIVRDVAEAARQIGADAEARGGYVESANIDQRTTAQDTSGAESGSMSMPYPYPGGGDWITVRVPAAELAAAVDALDDVGEVSSSSIGRQDVTDQAVDLRARVAASEASVARLTELIAQAESVADLLTAESALAERQATLDSDRQQLESLQSQVALATLSVQLAPETTTVVADPAGFGDGISAGWNGLVATLNGIVIAFGFLLPWLVVATVIVAIIWGVRRIIRRSRTPRPPTVVTDPVE